MTKQQSVQRAYQWATSVANNPKSGCVIGLCARQIITAVDLNERYDEAYGAIQALMDEWGRMKREGVQQTLKILSPMMVLERERSA